MATGLGCGGCVVDQLFECYAGGCGGVGDGVLFGLGEEEFFGPEGGAFGGGEWEWELIGLFLACWVGDERLDLRFGDLCLLTCLPCLAWWGNFNARPL